MSKKKVQKTGLVSQLPLAIKTGKYTVGFEQAIKSLITKQAKTIILSNNVPEHMRRKIEYYCVLSKNTPIEFFTGNSNDLNTLSGVGKRCCVISILDQGEADFTEVK